MHLSNALVPSLLPSLLATAALAASAHAHVYLVDDTPGPGVQFNSIIAAVAAAQPGDVLLVRAGNYLTFEVSEGITIFGIDGGAAVHGGYTIRDLPANQVFRAIRISAVPILVGSSPQLTITNCQGAVILDHSGILGRASATNSRDVRIRASSFHGSGGQIEGHGNAGSGFYVNASRVEFVDCTLTGGNALGPPMSITLGDGGPGLILSNGAEVHLARTTARGGTGGSSTHVEVGGAGGSAVRVLGTPLERCRVLVTGTPAHVFEGAAGGMGSLARGAAGTGIEAASSDLRLSGVTIAGTSFDAACVVVEPGRHDPLLEKLGGAQIGAPAPFAVRGVPGSRVDFVLGRLPVIVETPGLEEDVLALPGRVIDVGVIGGDGLLPFELHAPSSWPQFLSFVAQARVTLPDGSVIYTQSVPLFFH